MRKRAESAEFPPPLPAAAEGRRARESGSAGGSTGGGRGGGRGAGGGKGVEDEEVEDEEVEEANFEERLEALAQRGEFSTMKALLSEREARHAAASSRQDGV